MFSEKEMLDDLARADAAGDTELAKKIAFQIKVSRQQAADKKLYDPTAGMSGSEKFFSGVGESFDRLGNLFRSKEEVEQRDALNAPLEATGAGKVGQVVGDIVKGVAAGGAAGAALRGAVPLLTQGGGAALRAVTTAPKLIPAVASEALAGAGIGAAEAKEGERGFDALVGGLLGGAGELGGRAVGRVVAPYRSAARTTTGDVLGPRVAGKALDLPLQPGGTQVGTAGERALSQADLSTIRNALGEDVTKKIPLSGQLPGEAAQGPMRMEIALRNLTGAGAGLKHEDKAIRDAFTRALFRSAGTDVGEKAVGPQAFRLMDETLNAKQGALKEAAGPINQQALADRLMGVRSSYIPNALPTEREAAEAATKAAAARGADVGPAVAGVRAAEQGAEGARAVGAAEGVPDLRMALDAARENVVKARLAAGDKWQSDEAYKAARKEWDALRRAGAEVRPTEQAITGAERAVSQTGAGAQKALTRSQEAVAKAVEKSQQTGWASFDQLVKDASGAKTADELLELTRRSNDMFKAVREGADEAKTAKLDALRGFRTSLYETLDDALPEAQRGGFRELSQQWGMASTLRAARDSAGQGSFSPKAVTKELEATFGPKQAAAEKLPAQQLAGALERRAAGSFAVGPEQYKALMAGTLMGEGMLGMLQKAGAWAMTPGTMALLGTPAGRKWMQSGVPRELAARLLQEGVSGAATGQADLLGLF